MMNDEEMQYSFIDSDNLCESICHTPYFKDLLSTIKENGDIDAFLQKKDMQRIEILKQSDKFQQDVRNKKAPHNQAINVLSARSISAKHNLQIADVVAKKISELEKQYPASRQKSLRKLLDDCVKNGEINKKLKNELTDAPKGIFGKIFKGKAIKNANIELDEFLKYVENNDVLGKIEKDETSVLKNAFAGNHNDISKTKANNFIKDLETEKNKEEKLLSAVETNEIAKYKESMAEKNKSENAAIRKFVQLKAPYIQNPATISQEEIKTTGLNEDYIEGQIMQSLHSGGIRRSVRRFYEGLSQPAAPMVPYIGSDNLLTEQILANMKKKGLNAVLDTDPKAKDPDVFVVGKHSITAPFLAPEEALKANIMMIEAVYDSPRGQGVYLSNPMTRESMVFATDPQNKDDVKSAKNYDEKIVNEFYENFTQKDDAYTDFDNIVTMLQKDNPELANKLIEEGTAIIQNIGSTREVTNNDETQMAKDIFKKHPEELQETYFRYKVIQNAMQQGQSPDILDENIKTLESTGELKSVFHGGASSNPYAVLCDKEENMNFVYAAAAGNSTSFEVDGTIQRPAGALGYAFGKSSHNGYQNANSGVDYGFLFEYESRKDKQEFISIDAGGDDYNEGKFNISRVTTSNDETPLLPHQNKLKKMYIAVSGIDSKRKILPIELNDKNEVQDKYLNEFCKMHQPVYTGLKGNMIDRRNNMLKDYDSSSMDNLMSRKISSPEIVADVKMSKAELIETLRGIRTVSKKEVKTSSEVNLQQNMLLQKQLNSARGNE